MTPSTPAPKCKADFYALWCDNCNLHPVNCPLRSTPAPTDAGALADERKHYLGAIRLRLAQFYDECPNDARLREHISDECDWLDAEIARNSAPQETREDEAVAGRRDDFNRIVDAVTQVSVSLCQMYENEFGWDCKKCNQRWSVQPAHCAASQQSPRLERETLIEIIMRETTDKIVADGWDHLGSPNVLVQGCKFIRRNAPPSPEGYADPTGAARNFAGFVADAILALLSPDTAVVSSPEQVWQPADTAPHDGSTIEVRFLTDNPRRVRWSQSDRGTYWHLADSNGPAIINFNPTEWRPVSSNHPREVE